MSSEPRKGMEVGRVAPLSLALPLSSSSPASTSPQPKNDRIKLEIRQHDAPSFVSLFEHLAIQGLFWFHTNFRTVYSRTSKNAGGILIGIALKV